jgi:hypothetical protein
LQPPVTPPVVPPPVTPPIVRPPVIPGRAPQGTAAAGDAPATLEQQLSRARLRADFERMTERASPEAQPMIEELLRQPQVSGDAVVLRAAIADLAAIDGEIDVAAAKRTARRYGRQKLGAGFKLLAEAEPQLADKQVATNLAISGQLPEIDQIGARLQEMEKRAAAGKLTPARPLPETIRDVASELAQALTANGNRPRGKALAAHRAAVAEFVAAANKTLKDLGSS